MKKCVYDIKKNICKLFIEAFIKVINYSYIIFSLLITIIFFLLTALLKYIPDGNEFLGLSKAIWMAISGSVLASAIFAFFFGGINYFRAAKEKMEENYFKKYHNGFGIKSIYSQRGNEEVSKEYSDLLKNAKSRIWAIGIDNHNFCNDHIDILKHKFQTKASIDILVCFLSTDSKIKLHPNQSNEQEIEMSNAFNKLSDGIDKNMNLATTERINSLINNFKPITERAGRLRIFELTSSTFFTSFIIDDDVFFFPYVCTSNELSKTPIIQVSANSILGEHIIKHYEKIFDRDLPIVCKRFDLQSISSNKA
jgi:hypothetical protein